MRFSKAIFGNTDFLTAQAFIYSRDNFFNSLNNQVILACIITGIGEDVFNKVRQAGVDLEDKYFDSDLTVTERIKESLEFLQTTIKDVENLCIQIVFWQENVLYIQSLGPTRGFILRENEIISLVSGEGQLVSGYIKVGDRLLLISPRFNLDKEKVVDVLEQPGVASDDGELPEEQESLTEPQPDSLNPINWDKSLLDSLIHSSIDDLSSTLEEKLATPKGIEPVAAILIDNQLEQDFKAATDSKEDQSLASSIPDLTKNSFQEKPKLKIKLPSLSPLKRALKNILLFFLESKKRLILGLVILLVVISALILGSRSLNSSSQKDKQVQNLLSQAQSELTLAQSQKDTNPSEAKNNFSKSKDKLTKALKLKPNDSKAKELQNQINQATGDILKSYQVGNFPQFLSLDLIKPGFSTKKISYSLNQLLLLDETQKTLVSLDLDKKTNQILAGSNQLGNASFASLNGEESYAYSPDKGVVKVNLIEKKPEVIVKPDPDWGQVSDIFAFSGNVYLLDSLKNKIYKYVAIKNGFSDKLEYLKDGVQPGFNGASKLFIDYSVWVLKSGPEILRFTAGSPDNFSPGGLDTPIASIKSFFAPEDIDKFYILDSENSRVVVLKKSGEYLEEYTGEKFKTADDLSVNEEHKKMYLLEQNKIYTVDLH